jgi:signal transduction histidine kinase/ligand-binding sensor domain-containing protein
MGKPHRQRRYAAQGRAIAGLRTVQLSTLLSGILLAGGPQARALDPALDVSQYAHTAWKIRDGFTKGVITSITQAPDGYLWLGTEFGLLRFDGVRTVPWEPPSGEHLPESRVQCLLSARDGTLWIGTIKGLASWKDGKLTQYPELAGQNVISLVEDRGGTVWAGTFTAPAGKLCAIRLGKTQCYGEDGSLGAGVASLYEDSGGNLWVGARTGLWRWRPGPPKLYPMPDRESVAQGLIEDDNATLLIGTLGGLRQLVDRKAEAYPLPGSGLRFKPQKLFRDRDGGMWIGTADRGLLHVHRGRTDLFLRSDGLSGDWITALFEDREGNIWVATVNGLDCFRDFAVPTISMNQGLSTASVLSVLAARDGSVWLGTPDGLNRWNEGQVTIYRKHSARAVSSGANRELSGAPGAVREIRDSGLPDDDIWSLFQDDRERIWTTSLRGVAYFENGRFIPASALPGGRVYSSAGDRAANLWISYDQDLFRLSRGGSVEQIPWAKLGRNNWATTMLADAVQGGLWLGFWQGGVAYFKDGQVRASYAAVDGLGKGSVAGLQLDPDGTLWAATQGGLSRIKDGRVATLTSKNGLPCDTVHWAMEDDAHSFWLYLPCGLVRIARPELDGWVNMVDKGDPRRTIQVTVFDGSDGIRSRSDVGFSPRVAKTADGKLWFLPGDGVSVIDPRHLTFNKLPPQVHIEEVTADRKTYWQNLYGDAASLKPKLPPLVRDLTIDYTAPSLVVPEKVRFRYKLEGWDRDWQDAGTRRQAFYTNLGPRKYRFRVMACNNSGVWNEAGDTLDFSIAPAYYQTTWFRSLCVAAFMAALWGLYQLRLRQLAREFNAGLEARVNERTRIARELHDSLLQGFQGLMFRLQAVRDMLPGRAPAEAIEALDIALDRGDKAIAEGRDTVSNLREPIMGDSDIAQALTALGKELGLQSGNGSVPCVRVLLEGKQRELNPMLRDEVYRIAREALRNAFLHARAQKIEAEITYGDPEFLLHVRDDGGGIDPEVANQGARAGHWGLPGMRERAKSFGGKLEVWSEHGAGTEIKLRVPGAIAYGKSEPRRRFWLWPKKIGESDGQQS